MSRPGTIDRQQALRDAVDAAQKAAAASAVQLDDATARLGATETAVAEQRVLLAQAEKALARAHDAHEQAQAQAQAAVDQLNARRRRLALAEAVRNERA